MMERLNTDDREFVENEIRLSEEAHAAITRRHFGVNWQDSELYDLVLNTERLSVEECADEVLGLLDDPTFRETPESRRAFSNLALAAHVRGALRQDPRTAKMQLSITARMVWSPSRVWWTRDRSPSTRRKSPRSVPGVKEVKAQCAQSPAPRATTPRVRPKTERAAEFTALFSFIELGATGDIPHDTLLQNQPLPRSKLRIEALQLRVQLVQRVDVGLGGSDDDIGVGALRR